MPLYFLWGYHGAFDGGTGGLESVYGCLWLLQECSLPSGLLLPGGTDGGEGVRGEV